MRRLVDCLQNLLCLDKLGSSAERINRRRRAMWNEEERDGKEQKRDGNRGGEYFKGCLGLTELLYLFRRTDMEAYLW